jgi:hypothetical protein
LPPPYTPTTPLPPIPPVRTTHLLFREAAEFTQSIRAFKRVSKSPDRFSPELVTPKRRKSRPEHIQQVLQLRASGKKLQVQVPETIDEEDLSDNSGNIDDGNLSDPHSPILSPLHELVWDDFIPPNRQQLTPNLFPEFLQNIDENLYDADTLSPEPHDFQPIHTSPSSESLSIHSSPENLSPEPDNFRPIQPLVFNLPQYPIFHPIPLLHQIAMDGHEVPDPIAVPQGNAGNPPNAANAADAPNDIVQIVQGLGNADAEAAAAAAANFARYVQNLQQPPVPDIPDIITIREAVRRGRPADHVINLKLTDLLPAQWGSVKDGDPESHCMRFENFCNIHQYDMDDTKIAWFQATLKNDALNWFTANPCATWQEMRTAFISEFENQPSRNVAIANFRKIAWNGTERASTYLQRLQKAARLIAATNDDVMLQFELGLPRSVKLFFGAKGPTTLSEMVKTLQQYLELHGPVAISNPATASALSAMAEILTSESADPFLPSQQIPQSTALQDAMRTGAFLRQLANQTALNSFIQPDAQPAIPPNPTILKHSTEQSLTKRVRFKARTRPPMEENDLSDIEEAYPSSADDSGPEEYENTRTNSAPQQRNPRAIKKKPSYNSNQSASNNQTQRRPSNQNRQQDNTSAQSMDFADQMAKMLPMFESMASIATTGQPTYSNYTQRPKSWSGFQRPQNDYQQNNRNTPYQYQNSQQQGQRQRPRIPPGDGKCRYCGTYGHYLDMCRKRQQNKSYENDNAQAPWRNQPPTNQSQPRPNAFRLQGNEPQDL